MMVLMDQYVGHTANADLANYNIDISFLVTDAAKMVFNTGSACHTSKDVAEGDCLGNIEVKKP